MLRKGKFDAATQAAAAKEVEFQAQLEAAKAHSAVEARNSGTIKELVAAEGAGQWTNFQSQQ